MPPPSHHGDQVQGGKGDLPDLLGVIAGQGLVFSAWTQDTRGDLLQPGIAGRGLHLVGGRGVRGQGDGRPDSRHRSRATRDPRLHTWLPYFPERVCSTMASLTR